MILSCNQGQISHQSGGQEQLLREQYSRSNHPLILPVIKIHFKNYLKIRVLLSAFQ